MNVLDRLSKKEMRIVENAVDDAWETGHDLGDETAAIFMEDGVRDGEAAAEYYWDLLSYGEDWKEYRMSNVDKRQYGYEDEEELSADQITLDDLLDLPSTNRTVYNNLVDYFDGNGDEDAVQMANNIVNSDYDDPWSIAWKRELRKLLEEHDVKVPIKSDLEQDIRNYLNQGQNPASADITIYGIETKMVEENGNVLSVEVDNEHNATYGWETIGRKPGFKDLLMGFGMDLGEDNRNCTFYAEYGTYNRLVAVNQRTKEGYEPEEGDTDLVNVYYTVYTDMTKEQAEYAGFPIA